MGPTVTSTELPVRDTVGEADEAGGDGVCAQTRAAPGAIKGNLIHPAGSTHSCCRSELLHGGLIGKHAAGLGRNHLHKSNLSFQTLLSLLLSNMFFSIIYTITNWSCFFQLHHGKNNEEINYKKL